MNKRTRHPILVVCAIAAVLAVVAGCSNTTTGGTATTGDGRMGGTSQDGQDGGMMGGTGPDSDQGGGMRGGGPGTGGSNTGTYASDGERIYHSGVGVDGRDISRTAAVGSQGPSMMGGGGCASCHAADGRGGAINTRSGTSIKTPDITYDELIEDGFTDATIRTAITDGLDEAGKPLDDAMPRWEMSGEDLDAILAYLKALSAQ